VPVPPFSDWRAFCWFVRDSHRVPGAFRTENRPRPFRAERVACGRRGCGMLLKENGFFSLNAPVFCYLCRRRKRRPEREPCSMVCTLLTTDKTQVYGHCKEVPGKSAP